MNEKLVSILSNRLRREEMRSFVDKNPREFMNILNYALSDEQPLCWRAAWIINLTAEKNDRRLKNHIPEIVKALPEKEDGHQRELLKILNLLEISEDEEGYLFDACISIWGAVNKSPSVRITAFKIIADLLKKYPELKNEIEPLTEEHFTDTLSPGIKNTFKKLLTEITF